MKRCIILLSTIFCLTGLLWASYDIVNTKQRKLKKVGIQPFDVLIHKQSPEWLIEHFNERADEYPVNLSLMIRNIIWQQRALRMTTPTSKKLGKLPPFMGNIRSFWYSYIKIPLSRLNIQKESHYDVMIDQFVYLVRDRNLMRYSDFGFLDHNRFSKKIGNNHHIILFAEKRGHLNFLLEMHEKYDITIISLGGQPSLLSAEYFIDDMKAKKINVRQTFHLFSLVDFDPSGWIIRNAFIKDLEFYGIKTVKVFDLIHPNLLTQKEIDLRTFPVPTPPQMHVKNENWIQATGGILDEEENLYGIEAEAIERKDIEELLYSKIKGLLGTNNDDTQRPGQKDR